ncbi:cell division protein FtsQ/DivIB [Elusimicrobiota bacterium]
MRNKRLNLNKVSSKRSTNFIVRSNFKRIKNRSNFKLYLVLILTFAILYSGWRIWGISSELVGSSNFFKIESIEVVGGENVLPGEILALLPFQKGDNILRQPLKKIENDISGLKPELKNVSVSRGWKSIKIKIKERRPVAFVEIDSKRLGIDFDNKVFPIRGNHREKEIPQIIASDELKREEILTFLKMLLQNADELYIKARMVYYKSVDDIVIELGNNQKIIWGQLEKKKFRYKLNVLNEVLADSNERFSKTEYIDLCFFDKGRVLVKPLK